MKTITNETFLKWVLETYHYMIKRPYVGKTLNEATTIDMERAKDIVLELLKVTNTSIRDF